jgi:hypothetical protein
MNTKEDFYEVDDLRIFASNPLIESYIIHNQGVLLRKLNEVLKLIKEKQ